MLVIMITGMILTMRAIITIIAVVIAVLLPLSVFSPARAQPET